jgi:hypothetical protein
MWVATVVTPVRSATSMSSMIVSIMVGGPGSSWLGQNHIGVMPELRSCTM